MTAFVRRFSQRIAAWICTLRQRDWTRWQTFNGIGGPAHGVRRCKRCGKTEEGPAPKKRTRRAPTDADTVQPKP